MATYVFLDEHFLLRNFLSILFTVSFILLVWMQTNQESMNCMFLPRHSGKQVLYKTSDKVQTHSIFITLTNQIYKRIYSTHSWNVTLFSHIIWHRKCLLIHLIRDRNTCRHSTNMALIQNRSGFQHIQNKGQLRDSGFHLSYTWFSETRQRNYSAIVLFMSHNFNRTLIAMTLTFVSTLL